jgi:hypothetical protein
MAWEKVHAVHDFYDQPRAGVAAFEGRPHSFKCEFSEVLDDYTDRFFLMAVNTELMALVLEDWAIWLRWCEAFHRGDVLLKSHPALPEDRPRHDVIKPIVRAGLDIDPSKAVARRARFRWTIPSLCRDGGEVEWLPLDP